MLGSAWCLGSCSKRSAHRGLADDGKRSETSWTLHNDFILPEGGVPGGERVRDDGKRSEAEMDVA